MRTLATTLNAFWLVMAIIMTILFVKSSRTGSWFRDIEFSEASQCMFITVPSDINTAYIIHCLHHCPESFTRVIETSLLYKVMPTSPASLYSDTSPDLVFRLHIATEQDKALDITASM